MGCMAGGRSGKPLFELLRDDDTIGRRQTEPAQGPVGRTEFKPRATVQLEPRPAEVSRGPEPAPERDEGQARHSSVTIPTTTAYMLLALVLLLPVLAWVSSAWLTERRLASAAIADTDPPAIEDLQISDPIAGELGGPVPPVRIDQGRGSDAQRPVQPPPDGGAAGTIISSRGYLADDPRATGNNYLALAMLPEDQAIDAVMFLASNGVRSIGVPIDRRGWYQIISIEVAVPSGQYRAMQEQRVTHQRRVAEIGDRWVRERKGGSDFSQTNWERFGG